MILYTMMPHELVYPTDESEFGKQKMITRDGVPLLVEQMEGSEYRIIRNMSTDPSHYLNSQYEPGSKILLY